MKAIHNSIVFVNNYLPPTNHWLILASSVPVALSCGTLFAYSVYSTQLAEQCHLTTSQAANLNISTVVGSAIGGLLGGLVTDTYGTQLPMLISCVTIFLGYKWLYELYLVGAAATMTALVVTMFLIGIGSTAGYFSAIKAVTIEFPNFKGTAQSITIASFAISSLIYLYIATHVFHSDVARFLSFLHLSCGVMIFWGFLFVRVGGHYELTSLEPEASGLEETVSESSPLLAGPEVSASASAGAISSTSGTASGTTGTGDLKSLSLSQSLKHPVFWFHFFIFAIMQGLGQMYIFEVGFILKAVHYYYNDDLIPLNHLQALHVSLIAIFSFLGRLSSGPQSDLLVNKLKCQRHWNLIMGLSIMLIGHFLNTLALKSFASTLQGINVFLLVVSCLIGYAYGFSFTCYPAIISDIFNMANYSFIWGFMYSSTALGLTLMTKMFGYIYDRHSHYEGEEYVCSEGAGCYRETFGVTCGLCLFVILLVLGYIRTRASAK